MEFYMAEPCNNPHLTGSGWSPGWLYKWLTVVGYTLISEVYSACELVFRAPLK